MTNFLKNPYFLVFIAFSAKNLIMASTYLDVAGLVAILGYLGYEKYLEHAKHQKEAQDEKVQRAEFYKKVLSALDDMDGRMKSGELKMQTLGLFKRN